MTIYFCGSIAGGRKFLKTYTKIVRWLQHQGHTIPSEHIIAENVLDQENKLSAQQIYNRDIEWLTGADAVIAEISNPSLGVGYEICYALHHQKPVLGLFHKNVFVSRMITGNTNPNLSVCDYSSDMDWQKQILKFIERIR